MLTESLMIRGRSSFTHAADEKLRGGQRVEHTKLLLLGSKESLTDGHHSQDVIQTTLTGRYSDSILPRAAEKGWSLTGLKMDRGVNEGGCWTELFLHGGAGWHLN